jgi:hypothetical protein
MYEYEKVTVEVFKVRVVWYKFISKFSIFRCVRKDVSNCEFCETSFMLDAPVHLAFTSNTTNKLICTDCADKALDGGAEHYRKSDLVN